MTETAPAPTAPPAPRARPVPNTTQQRLTRQDVFSALGTLGAVLTVVTAVMFYFGWRRSAVQAEAMSIDVSLFGFTPQDYVLRSISSLYLPLLVVAGTVLAWLALHARLRRLLRSPEWQTDARRDEVRRWTLRIVLAAAVVAGLCVVFTLLVGLTSPPAGVGAVADRLRDSQWVVPLVLAASTLTAAYAWWLHRQVAPVVDDDQTPLWQRVLASVLVAGTVALAGIWMLEEYASAVGQGYAQQVAVGVDRLPRAVVLSPRPLGIDAPGVDEDRVAMAGETELYRTTGLRLLARSGGKVLLLHDGWTPSSGTVVVLPDSDELAWQFSR